MRIFVYGTLRKGGSNFGLMKDANFIAKGTVGGVLLDYGGYPALVSRPHGYTLVHGEIYDVDAPTLARLDKMEGHPHYYRRTMLAVNLGSAHTYPADTYVPVKPDLSAPVIESGDWIAHYKGGFGVQNR